MKDLVEFGRKLGVTLAKECIPCFFPRFNPSI
jgi:hypothetical protein